MDLSGEHIIKTLRAHRAELEALGVRHAELFGSRAVGNARPDSDIDIAVEIQRTPEIRGMRYFGRRGDIERLLHKIFRHEVHLSDVECMKPYIKEAYINNRLNAF